MSGPKANEGDPKFKWGKKSHTGRIAEKPAYFYESFTYDGIEYFLYDSVYLHAANEPEPYIGKLLKAWEYGDPAIKKIKVLWFFCPIELQNWLGDHQPQENELFLASGEGVGLANINPLTWEEQMRKAQEHGKLILLSNLDPSYVSTEVEEIIWNGFREKCKAKVLQCTFSSPYCGQAFVIFITREAAELVIKRLNEGCLILPNGRYKIYSDSTAGRNKRSNRWKNDSRVLGFEGMPIYVLHYWEIIWNGFREKCKAKVLQCTFSSPYCGQAFVIFITREAAELVIKRLNEGCLILPNGRPLVAAKRAPILKESSTKFVGHLSVDKLRVQNKEEWKRAVFTSHCSQPNTIEYEMALQWKLLQKQFDRCWRELYEQQGKELKGLKSHFKKE